MIVIPLQIPLHTIAIKFSCATKFGDEYSPGKDNKLQEADHRKKVVSKSKSKSKKTLFQAGTVKQ